MFYQLPPAGDPIPPAQGSATTLNPADLFGSCETRFYSSGTAALAAALIAVAKLNKTSEPEVILPAYSCPAILSAALYADIRPVLVDLEHQRPWMELGNLRKKISQRTVALVAVNFLGIPERLDELREIAGKANIRLIYDSAQSLPDPQSSEEQGDLIVLSFGRGKPVSLLQGGAVLTSDEELIGALVAPDARTQSRLPRAATFYAKVRLYNLFRSPFLYWLPASLPFLHLGETRFEPLVSIAPMEYPALSLLPSALMAYRQRGREVQHRIAQPMASLSQKDILDLPAVCCDDKPPKLLRYPLLVLRPELRDRLLEDFGAAGLGASVMYPRTLPHIPGLEQHLALQGPFPNAEEFSRCLLTLPTHSSVKFADTRAMECILEKTLHSVAS